MDVSSKLHDTPSESPTNASDGSSDGNTSPWALVDRVEPSHEPMDVDQDARLHPNGDDSDVDDLYASDSDGEFLDAASRTLSSVSVDKVGSTPAPPELSLDASASEQNKSQPMDEETKTVTYALPDTQNYQPSTDIDPESRANDSKLLSASSRKSADYAVRVNANIPNRAQLASRPHPKRDFRQRSQSRDLVDNIKGMYRILDLFSEQGSGGLVDKIIIAQESSGQFINDLSPGAYKDLTKVDFKAMDNVHVKPLGVYGSKNEIVRFLRTLGVIDDRTETLLNAPQDVSMASPILRSGLYALTVEGDNVAERRLYIIFWPEDTTWDDNAVSTVRRNRITFMRYLTQITEQIMVLISDVHGQALVWEDPGSAGDDNASSLAFDDIEEETDRLFAFEVSKANEQEEKVQIRPGFKFKNPNIKEAPALGTSLLDVTQLRTRLVAGDTKQGLMTVDYSPPQESRKDFVETARNRMQLEHILFSKGTTLRLGKNLSYDAILILVENGLKTRFPEAVSNFEKRELDIQEQVRAERRARADTISREIEAEKPKLTSALEAHFVQYILAQFPKLDEAALRGRNRDEIPSQETQDVYQEYLRHLFDLHPSLHKVLEIQQDNLTGIKSEGRAFTKAMRKVVLCNHIYSHNKLTESERETVWDLIDSGIEAGSLTDAVNSFKEGDKHHNTVISSIASGIAKIGRGMITFAGVGFSEPNGPLKEARAATRDFKAVDFFSRVDSILEDWPELTQAAEATFEVAHKYFAKKIKDALRILPHKLIYEQTEICKTLLERELGTGLSEARKTSCAQLFDDLEKSHLAESNCGHVIFLQSLDCVQAVYRFSDNSYRCIGYHTMQSEPSLKFTIHPLELKEYDKQQMKMNLAFIPKPNFTSHYTYNFNLPVGAEIRLFRILEGNKCLAVIDDRSQDLHVYSESLISLGAAISNRRPKKEIKREKTGHDIAVAYDEGKRALVICGVDTQKPSVQLHCFAFDERYTSLQGQGSAINLTAWYNDIQNLKIISIQFVSGTDEFALIEDSGKVRVFSSVTQQFRPAVLQLPATPLSTFGTPDGSCLAAIFDQGSNLSLRVYHWASLGSHEGFSFDFPELFGHTPLISSLDEKKNIHLIWLNLKDGSCRSIGIDITCQVTEFQFREKNSKNTTHDEQRRTAHNSIIDCHSDVWTRFPVVPAVRRQAIVSGELRRDKFILFLTTSRSDVPFVDYFYDMIQTFERSTKKPTASFLNSISILSDEISSALSTFQTQSSWSSISSYKAGEWMVDIFCLIPIHIAIARDNRFIPLKDGVWAPEVEKALLGADVGRVADSLSFGWYESIFQSYMSTKPVKVVSSMGEQSVGKSFALNHLADTSFAGSAMRTTEGVWMSVTPTVDDLIVALDFEGVHSIERSAQEDTLLVLFNAAISNLVLFRNNFALSRDITNLFQSFQSSSSILDPDTNPSLFQSTLVIIIKDVVDSDRVEIAREFKLKLHKIVEEEQASNFISRLYRGRLNIIPWPVIESRQFYTLFSTLKRHLDKQSSTHEGGGTFLLKMKMLMAKLKTNDWGSLSQNMSTHRAQHLLSLLPKALMFGATEVEPDVEPLKNFDTNIIVDAADSEAVFHLDDLVAGHSQPEHSTNHGSMSKTLWAIDGPNGTALELNGHKFGSSDDGAPMLCNLMCSSMGRHAHIEYCRSSGPGPCNEPEIDHIRSRIEPNPERAKDWISHKLYWRRLGFKDPYSREEQTNFAKCDAMCCGSEHRATATSAAQPSYCNLPIFHQAATLTQVPSGGVGHVSNDGHVFSCKNPAILSQAFHVIFVIDRSGSMSLGDRQPLANYPASAGIARVANNRLGAVYSALHSFWSARATAMSQASVANRRDAYSAILFSGSASEVFSNDFSSTPDQLLTKVLPTTAGGGTNFDSALGVTERLMERHWSTERAPIVIFLSDGECSMTDNVMYSLCRKAVGLGRALSFHSVSFGPDGSSTWLRRMAQIAQEVQSRAPRDPLLQANAVVESSYSVALDSVRLAETFLGIAESLRKTRAGVTVPRPARKRNRKRKRRNISSSSSSSSDSADTDSSDSEAKNATTTGKDLQTQKRVALAASLSESTSESSSSSDSDSDSDSAWVSRRNASRLVHTAGADESASSKLGTGPENSKISALRPRVDSPPPRQNVAVPNLLEGDKEQKLKERFRQFWMASVVDGFADDLNEIRKEPNLTPARLALLIDSLAAGADVYASSSRKDSKPTNEMEVVIGE
ncbi:hypothetical protein EW145_g511 [Phellinidium pouzarii]|uniref:VWFA domain-containing protein n=1 Tax=Phellinidium pouzarii TaxID=167371 RepID=A0A4S4LI04_9AGAM|nr:hypothetical protein EW145_g511 [Phellinidium pouzarii]